MRALGLQQVRTEAKGPAATKRFAALLPKLPPYWPNAKARQRMDEVSAHLRAVLYPQALNHEKVCAPSHDVVLAAMKEVVADHYTEGARSLERQLALALGTLYRVN